MNTKARRTIALSLAIGAATLAAAGVGTRRGRAEDALRGVWTIQPSRWTTSDGPGGTVVQLSLRRSREGHDWNSSFPVPLPELRGLTAEQLRADRADVRFDLARDAGAIAAEGRFEAGEGAGHFTFTPSADYAADLRRQGYDGLDAEKMFTLAVLHGATPEFIRELQALGYAHPSVDQLVSLRIHGATTDFVRALKQLGYEGLTPDGLVSLRIHGATPEFVRELQGLGYSKLTTDELVSMRIHGVTPAFVRELRELGYEHVPVDALVSMRIHGVTPEFIRRVKGRTSTPVSVDRLVDMRIHGRDE
ncbi:MAG: hypothetical protein DMF78_07780 [Acidobacteria bacterium]|nr:MAG: hypothetical protein DMF78_07780 [Acidobacteriota bacterium]